MKHKSCQKYRKTELKGLIGVRGLIFLSRIIVLSISVVAPGAAHAAFTTDLGGVGLSLTGYVREYLGVNLENKPDIMANGEKLEGKWDLNMARSVLLLDGKADFGRVRVTAIGRWSREVETNYLDRLNDSSTANIMNSLNDNDLREMYVDLDVSDRIKMRLGKQQVAWGEADSFQVLDIINPFDFNWRSSFEAENEELRKPLIMANVNIGFPLLNGSLQLLFRPGWDDAQSVAATLPFDGGRFAPQGNLGVNANQFIPFNYHHNRGDTKDASYGGRWSGTVGPVGYTLNYYHTVSGFPVINFANITGSPNFRQWGAAPKMGFAEFVFPEIDVYGFSFNSYLTPIDTVLRGELAYFPDKPYNHGFSGTPLGGALNIIEKDTVSWMLGLDKQFPNLTSRLGTTSSPLLTGQIIDTWIPNFNQRDDLLESGVTPRREHSTVITLITALSYNGSNTNPSFGLLYDATYGGGAVLASLTNVIGDHWRIYSEYLGFFKNGQTCSVNPTTGNGIDCQHGFGNFDNKDQITVRVTYQF